MNYKIIIDALKEATEANTISLLRLQESMVSVQEDIRNNNVIVTEIQAYLRSQVYPRRPHC